MYCSGKLEPGGRASLSGRYGFINIESLGNGQVCVHGKRGKKYHLWLNTTDGDALTGARMFPRVAVQVTWQADNKCHVWIKSFAKAQRKNNMRQKRQYRKY